MLLSFIQLLPVTLVLPLHSYPSAVSLLLQADGNNDEKDILLAYTYNAVAA